MTWFDTLPPKSLSTTEPTQIFLKEEMRNTHRTPFTSSNFISGNDFQMTGTHHHLWVRVCWFLETSNCICGSPAVPFPEARACALGEAESLMSHKCEEEARRPGWKKASWVSSVSWPEMFKRGRSTERKNNKWNSQKSKGYRLFLLNVLLITHV